MALTGKNTEEMIWNFLKSKGLNSYGTAGLMGNLYAESGLNPKNLQNDYESRLGYDDDSYTLAIDRGTYSQNKFKNDQAGYGLAQWTYSTRKSKLITKAKNLGKSIGDLETQLSYLYEELSQDFPDVLNVLKTATSVKSASDKVLLDFENPRDKGENVKQKRAGYGQVYYSKYSGMQAATNTKGHKLVEEARKHVGKPYVFGGNGPNFFDCSGYIKYVYNTAIDFGMTERTAFTQEKLGKSISTPGMAGDLVFFKDTYTSGNTPNISHVGMMLGDGDSFIQASGSSVNVASLSESYWASHYYSAKRLLDESETFSGGGSGGSYVSESAIDTITGLAGGLPLSNVNYYSEELRNAIDLLDKSSNSYCSLIDLTKGGEFKFYLPESFTESLPVSWDNNSGIIGRSVPVVGYNGSGPRSIPIELTLMAGAGYYDLPGDSHEEVMTAMYSDIDFVRSLVYPDYSKSIVEPPSVVLLSCGAHVRLKGVVSGLTVNYCKPVDDKNRAMKVILSFTVSQVSDEPPGRSDIRANNLRSY